MRAQSTQDFTAFATAREAELIGAKFDVQARSDSIVYTVMVPQLHVAKATSILVSAATSLLFSRIVGV